MINVEKISKQYGSLQALKDISFQIEEGTCFGLVGPNGAGKSTLMKILSGILLDFEGDIRVRDWKVSKDRLKIKQHIGYVPQEICLEETLTARDNLLLFGSLYGVKKKELQKRMEEVFDQIGLTERAKDKVETFSGGMKRRLNIGCTLLHRPDIIIMDEPTVGIDPQSRNSIFSLIHHLKKSGTTIIYSSHYIEEVEQLCESVGLIDKGRLIEYGKMEDLLERYAKPSLFISGTGIDENLLRNFGDVEKKGNGYLLNSAHPLLTLKKLVTHCHEHNLEPHRLELYHPRLEDIFFHLTGTQLRNI
ncbi:ABC transporter ATP-binding protein [Salimicrobium flavidum]|uniref:ABC-2 type transport system ATP-binding protein n=1 Tax=Salimicrobium flavidum TaxID=570947 RepID=A0A1N7K193_9BACI|nr:ABC transporter ATP-binding protein [Salimicrobium flavidum]SIS55365.1 ABC-2 type transport system ATP-binding protein [Salimicrobium flavidum]